MLQGSQASDEILIEGLLREYFTPVARLALALLGDRQTAVRAVQEIFAGIVLNRHLYRAAAGVRPWVFVNALCEIERLRARRQRASQTVAPADDRSAAAILATLEEEERLFAALRYIASLPDDEITLVSGHDPAFVAACLSQIQARLAEAAPGDETSLEERIAAAAQNQWPAPELGKERLRSLQHEIERRLIHKRGQQRRTVRAVEVGLGLAALALVVVVSWLSNVFTPPPTRSTPIVQTVVVTSTGAVIGIPATPTPPWGLNENSPIGDVAQRMNDSLYTGWQTLWADALIINYGPTSYIGPPQVYRNQIWLDRNPRRPRAVVLGGPPEGQPDYLRLMLGREIYEKDLTDGIVANTTLDYPSLASLEVPAKMSNGGNFETPSINRNWLWRQNRPYGVYLYPLLLPSFELLSLGQGQVVGSEPMAGQRAVKVWMPNNSSDPSLNLWIDASTGTVLRWQELDRRDMKTVTYEVRLTAVTYDVTFPDDFFTLDRLEAATSGWDQFWQPTLAVRQAIPTLDDLSVRQPIQAPPAPAGFDPAHSVLTFQWADVTTPQQAEILAEDYSLGQIELGDVWSLYCQRSPDGKKLAVYNYFPSERRWGIRWRDLSSIQEFHDPLPNAMQVAPPLAFSPDSTTLAFWGCGGNDANCGIYLHNLETRKNKKLYSSSNAPLFLAWKPDSTALALIRWAPQEAQEDKLLILGAEFGDVIYQGPYRAESLLETPFFDWITSLTLAHTYGPEGCTAPTQSSP